MSQHDYVIDNANGAAVRLDLNNALAAIQSMNSGATAPTATVAFMFWFDTTADTMKVRDSGDTAWVSVFDLNGTVLIPIRNGTVTGDAAEQTVGTAALADLPNIEDIQNKQGVFVTATGTADAITIPIVPAISTYVEGQEFDFKAAANNTGAMTVDVNLKGVEALLHPNGDAMVAGDILIANHYKIKKIAGSFQLMGGRTKATQAEAEAGLQNTRFMTALRTQQAITALAFKPTIFLANGTYTVPAGVTEILVEAIGGGGGGGGGAFTIGPRGGGGGSGARCRVRITVTPSGSETVVVGQGGAGGLKGVSGLVGTASTVGGAKCSAGPGTGGIHSGGAAGVGGTCSATETRISFNRGVQGTIDADVVSIRAKGGGSPLTSGHPVDFSSTLTYFSNDQDTTELGSGGDGGTQANSGANGSDGFVIITPVA